MINKDMISLSASAASHIRTFTFSDPDMLGIQISVLKSGCSGWMTRVDAVEFQPAKSHKFYSRNIRIFVLKEHFEYLKGTEIDYVRQGLNEKFIFNSPNVDTRCGCGESVNYLVAP